MLIGALVFAVAGYRSLGWGAAVAVYVGGLMALMLVGYLVWRRGGPA